MSNLKFEDNPVTYFAESDYRNRRTRFGIKRLDRLRHVYVIGKTGMGKSTLLENMAAQDIQNGEGFAFIDPHGKTAELLLDYIPEDRIDDVVYFAPFDAEYPIAFNVMEDVGKDKRHLVANGLMSAFKKIWIDAWSARMEYILNNCMLALLEYPDSTLLGINRMLADKSYRNKIVANISDPAVKSFWVDEFAKYGERYMQEAGSAIQNKVGQFISNPLVRNMIGQPKSTFDIRQIMDERKIIIVNLSKGKFGEQNANLIGSMLITKIYLAAMSRADASPAQMNLLPNFYLYVDEFQSFANESFADILSEARKYKLNLTMAHQYIEQMEETVRAAVFGNVGTTVTFRVGPFDAEILEKMFAPQFTAEDLVNLGFAQIYLTLMIDGVGSTPFSAETLPPILAPERSLAQQVIERSRKSFGRPRDEVELYIHQWHGSDLRPENQGARTGLRPKAPSGADEERVQEKRDQGGGSPPKKRADTATARSERTAAPRAASLKTEPRKAEPPKTLSLAKIAGPMGQGKNVKNLADLRDALKKATGGEAKNTTTDGNGEGDKLNIPKVESTPPSTDRGRLEKEKNGSNRKIDLSRVVHPAQRRPDLTYQAERLSPVNAPQKTLIPPKPPRMTSQPPPPPPPLPQAKAYPPRTPEPTRGTIGLSSGALSHSDASSREPKEWEKRQQSMPNLGTREISTNELRQVLKVDGAQDV